MSKHLALILSLILSANVLAIEFSSPHVNFIDSDTIEMNGRKIRLEGIDGPEYSQTCNKSGKDWRCGIEATNRLKRFIGSQPVRCVSNKTDAYNRLLATCWVNKTNINQWMVMNGWAVAFLKYSDLFIEEEKQAKQEGKGIWKSEFIRPNNYRHSSLETAKINSPNPNCPIKGNINSKGNKIYHTPWGSPHYNRTKISIEHGERWFCSEPEALAAGWRAPYR